MRSASILAVRATGVTPKRCASAGFTLIEIVIAFAIAALSMVALMRIFNNGLTVTERAGDLTHATLIAQSKLAQVGTEFPLEDGGQNGEVLEGRYRWQITITPYEVVRVESVDSPVGAAPLAQPLEMKQVNATVSYGDPPRSVSLVTYKTIGKKL
jgi:general secretion pathway protein I